MKRKAIASLLIIVLIMTVAPSTAFAGYDSSTFTNSTSTAPSFNLGSPTVFGGSQPTADTSSGENYYQFNYQWKKFTISKASIVTVTVDVPQQANLSTGWYPNGIQSVQLFAADGTTQLRSGDNTTIDMSVRSDEPINSKSTEYKLLPGTYYVRVQEWRSNVNGYGNLTVTATVPQDDFGKLDPINDSMINAKPVKFNTLYKGLIGYTGKFANNSYTDDFYQYYKFTVPNNNYGITLYVKRGDQTKEFNYNASIRDQNNYTVGETISLRYTPSVTKNYTLSNAGTYYIYLNSWPSNYEASEIEFRLTPIPTPLLGISLPKTSYVQKNKMKKLSVTYSPSNAANKKVTWTSSDNAVATVDVNGNVKGIKKGTARITARSADGGYTASCTVTVRVPATKMTLNKKSATIKKGKTVKLKVKKFYPSDVNPKTIKWSSSNKKVAKVNSKGVVKGIKKGKATITAKSWNGKTIKCKIKVK